jgi:oligopeptide transport system ATP-binding protein
MSLLEVSGLSKTFGGRRGFGRAAHPVHAVSDVTFSVEHGQTLALVGESGAGKSTVGRLVLRLIEPDAGSVTFDGVDVLAMKARPLRSWRSNVQMIFQNPARSLDPLKPVGVSVAEPLLVHQGMGRTDRLRRATELLESVGIGATLAARYPSELSGGQLQRAAIARALASDPKLIVCDEPLSALDVSVRTQVLNVMTDLQKELGIAYLFISHDLALMRIVADQVAVMSKGRLVEQGTIDDVFDRPQDAFTRELLNAIPSVVPRKMRTP